MHTHTKNVVNPVTATTVINPENVVSNGTSSSGIKQLVFLMFFTLFAYTSVSHAVPLALFASDENSVLVPGFKWTLEEDPTFVVDPGTQTPNSISLSFHTSYAPVVASGECTGAVACTVDVDPAKRYFVSVLPFAGHSIGGAQIDIGQINPAVVSVHTTPIPTAQITVELFFDIAPINGAIDNPVEVGHPAVTSPAILGAPNTGEFEIILIDSGGRYGQTGGRITQDAFGNPLGTEYAIGDPSTILSMGTGFLTPDPVTGFYTIKNLAPAKYGVEIIPPSGQGWIQTATIEGTRTIDAWVKANEPAFFAEFGPPGPHVFIGFTKAFNNIPAGGTTTISGTITSNHMERPPAVGFYSNNPVSGCWVGLNSSIPGNPAIAVQPCAADGSGSFVFSNVPAGTYQLVTWDAALDYIITARTVSTVDAITGAAVDAILGDIPIFSWFNRFETTVFFDADEDGFMDPGDIGIPEQAVNLRFRNGTTYASFPTDLGGEAPFDEVFPFFHWLVAEVDFARYKATGATYVVDNGGPVPADNGWTMPSFDILTPQHQIDLNPNTGNDLSTTMKGQVLTLGYQGFLGQTNIIQWGKALYGTQDIDVFPYGDFPGPGDTDHDSDGVFEYGNGGISGLVTYSITRAENDPALAAVEEWEPGIARVQLNLYRDANEDGFIDDLDLSHALTNDIDLPPLGNFPTPADGDVDQNSNGIFDYAVTLADIDNAPQGNFPGAEDVDRNGNLSFDYGDAVQITYSDSWDDNLPSGCKGPVYIAHQGSTVPGLEQPTDCFDGLRNFNQIRPGVFDGGYAFASRIARDAITGVPTGDEIPGLLSSYYIVETSVPPGYELVKEEDKNVAFGDEYIPALLPPACVGEPHLVPAYVSYLTDASGVLYDPANAIPDNEAPFAGQTRPLCDRKRVSLTAGKNAAADFVLFTQAPISANVVGGILNDLANEFDPNNPNFGEKFAPSWLPVTFSDWTGRQVHKVYTDEFGKFDARVPSTSTVNIGSPTGVSPNMLIACMNDPSPVENPAFNISDPASPRFVNDPNYNPQFSTFCYTFQYMAGSTTYLDTPVVPLSAFASTGNFPLDCEIPDNQPVIQKVEGPSGTGPAIASDSWLPPSFAPQTLTIFSEGTKSVKNHLFGNAGEPINIIRSYGFGATQGTVTLGSTSLNVLSWANTNIVVEVPFGTATGQLSVITANGIRSSRGVTVTTHLASANIHNVVPTTITTATPIQNAIDLAAPGDLILVAPGTYNELVIMDKPVQLQGWGAGATKLTAIRHPTEKLALWREQIKARAGSSFTLLPGQVDTFDTEEAPGFFVGGTSTGNFTALMHPRIDGFEISGAISGGGIFVNAFADFLEISNNKIINNQGTYGGGIRIGNPTLTVQVPPEGLDHIDSNNNSINIHDNEITQNGSGFGSAGGVGLYTGTDSYNLSQNWVCGNFSQKSGAGIAHLGLSNNGQIVGNTVAFNQSFSQGSVVHGAGIFVGGQPGLATGETSGSGNVLIEGNLIQGNQAGAGHGAGIYLSQINGTDVALNPLDSTMWYGVNIFDNIIVNNVAGWTGAGIGMQDAAKVNIINNTIANNDSTATATIGATFDPVTNTTTAQTGAGIVSLMHSAALTTALVTTGQTFSDPVLQNNIIWHNRVFSWGINFVFVPAVFTLSPSIELGELPVYSDLGVMGPGSLYPVNSILTDITGTDPSNISVDPGFVLGYANGGPGQVIIGGAATVAIVSAAALDEAGNFVDVGYGPRSVSGSYHLRTDSLAINQGIANTNPDVGADIDGDVRAATGAIDVGADEVSSTAVDTDGDGILDSADNCTLLANPLQTDTDADNFGNRCDADFNNDGVVNTGDLVLFANGFFTTDALRDLNGDGVVNTGDLVLLANLFFLPPGPSGTAN